MMKTEKDPLLKDDISRRLAGLSPEKRRLMEKRLGRDSSQGTKENGDAIAVIGMGCRFPGGADDPDAFWELLLEGRSVTSQVPDDRWNPRRSQPVWQHEASKQSPIRWGGYLGGVDRFDASFFNISPREAEQMDPQQRLLLMVAWEALEAAGLDAEALAGSTSGVFMGIHSQSSDYYWMQIADARAIDTYTATGCAHSIVANRLSYCLNFKGPSLAVDTACSSSLVALHLACQSLRNRECDLALVGGVNLILSPETSYAFSKLQFLSPDGQCKTFDAAANGFVRGEGCGVLVLRRNADAVRSGDAVQAIIRGSAVNQDGATNGLTAPNGLSQQTVVRQAIKNAGVDAGAITFVETHGTGTVLGDPIEVEALDAVLRGGKSNLSPCHLGAVKSNIGHLEAAAGIAGVIKTVLCLRHRFIPPNANFSKLNPHIDLSRNRLKIPRQGVPWEDGGQSRLGGVSSFGFGGTNAHVVLQEAPQPAPQARRQGQLPGLFTLSAKSDTALKGLAKKYIRHLSANPELGLDQVCFTANTGRAHFDHRLAVAAASLPQLSQALSDFERAQKSDILISGRTGGEATTGVAFLFTGQGSQYAGMARELFESQPRFRETLSRCDQMLRDHLKLPLLKVLYPHPGSSSPLDDTVYTQPALFAVEYALADLWKSWGITPDAVMGHSIGEYVAACLAGVFSLEEALALVAARARLMQSLPQTSKMLAVLADARRVTALVDAHAEEVAVAAFNGPENTVIAGARHAVTRIEADLRSQGIKSVELAVSHGFHSPAVEPILGEFKAIASRVTYAAPQIDMISNVTGRSIGAEAAHAEYWCAHMRQPVRFADSLQTLFEQGFRVFLEVGPKPVLLGMGRSCLKSSQRDDQTGPVRWLPSLRPGRSDLQQMLQSLGELYVSGRPVAWQGLNPKYGGGKIALPTYAWQQSRHWIADDIGPYPAPHHPHPRVQGAASHHGLPGRPLASAIPIYEHLISGEMLEETFCYKGEDCFIFPLCLGIEMALAAAADAVRSNSWQLEHIDYSRDLVFSEHAELKLQLVLQQNADGFRFEVFRQEPDHIENSESPQDLAPGSKWTLHISGQLVAGGAKADPALSPAGTTALQSIQSRCRAFKLSSLPPLAAEHLPHAPAFEIEGAWTGSGEALLKIEAQPASGESNDFGSAASSLTAAMELSAVLFALMQEESREDERWRASGARLVQTFEQTAGPTAGPSCEAFWVHVACDSGAAPPEKSALTGLKIEVLDAEGGVIARMDELDLKSVPRKRWRGHRLADQTNPFYTVAWRRHDPVISPPEENRAGDAGRWLIFTDGDGIGDRLLQCLQAAGHDGIIVEPGAGFEDLGNGRFRVDPTRPGDFELLAQSVASNSPHGLLGAVHLWGLWAADPEDSRPGAIHADVLRSCGSALLLHKCLATQPSLSTAPIWLVTRGAQPVADRPASMAIAQAPLWGFGRVVALESPNALAGLIDLDPDMATEACAERLYDEIMGADGEEQIAIRGRHRFVARLVNRPLTPAGAAPLGFDGQGSYLITGGLGRIGLKVAQWMAEQGAGHLVLLGRKGLATEGSDAAHAGQGQEDPGRTAVAAMRKAAVDVQVVCADVGNRQQMAALFDRFGKDWPPLRGVLHAAGVIEPQPLAELETGRLASALDAKVRGTWILHELIGRRAIDFFVLFSSASSILGSKDLAHYAAANHFLDAYAHYGRLNGRPVSSINWGWWAGGWKDNHLSKHLGQAGLHAISDADGMAALKEILLSGSIQTMYADIDWRVLTPVYEAKKRRAFLDEVRPAAVKPVSSRPSAVHGLIEELHAALPDQRVKLLRELIRTRIASLLGFQDPSQLDIEAGFFTLGMDSIMAVELQEHIDAATGLDFPATVVFEYPTIKALADYVAGLLFAPPKSRTPDAQGMPAEAIAYPADEQDRQALSEKDLLDLLSEKLKEVR